LIILYTVYHSGKISSDSSLQDIVQKLRHKHNCTVEISVDSEDNLVGLFIQDSIMQNIFQAFPEIKIIDLLTFQIPVIVNNIYKYIHFYNYLILVYLYL